MSGKNSGKQGRRRSVNGCEAALGKIEQLLDAWENHAVFPMDPAVIERADKLCRWLNGIQKPTRQEVGWAYDVYYFLLHEAAKLQLAYLQSVVGESDALAEVIEVVQAETPDRKKLSQAYFGVMLPMDRDVHVSGEYLNAVTKMMRTGWSMVDRWHRQLPEAAIAAFELVSNQLAHKRDAAGELLNVQDVGAARVALRCLQYEVVKVMLLMGTRTHEGVANKYVAILENKVGPRTRHTDAAALRIWETTVEDLFNQLQDERSNVRLMLRHLSAAAEMVDALQDDAVAQAFIACIYKMLGVVIPTRVQASAAFAFSVQVRCARIDEMLQEKDVPQATKDAAATLYAVVDIDRQGYDAWQKAVWELYRTLRDRSRGKHRRQPRYYTNGHKPVVQAATVVVDEAVGQSATGNDRKPKRKKAKSNGAKGAGHADSEQPRVLKMQPSNRKGRNKRREEIIGSIKEGMTLGEQLEAARRELGV